MKLLKGLAFAKTVTAQALQPGDIAVDATVGTGHDSLHLAQAVGHNGYVYGFDIQASALAVAERRLVAAGVQGRVRLLHRGHEHLATAVPIEAHGRVKAIMFNLGYLPGSDKKCITVPETTLTALAAACTVLAAGGVITIVCYTGHPGGQAEAEAVEAWARTLHQNEYQVLSYQYLNQRNTPPRLLVLQRHDE